MMKCIDAEAWLDQRLKPDEQELLRGQGSVCRLRPSEKFSLRFRDQRGCQKNIYIGDAELASAIAVRLAELQAPRHAAKKLRQAQAAARAAELEGRALVAPILRSLGYHFHGFSIRRVQRDAKPSPPSNNSHSLNEEHNDAQ